MKELSVFVDESGDFGEYEFHSPFYILSLIIHEQDISIDEELKTLDQKLSDLGLHSHTIHVGPIIRQEYEYRTMDFHTRRKALKHLMAFFRHIDIKCKTFYVEKKNLNTTDNNTIVASLTKQLARFINEYLNYFLSFDVVKVYYDNGQLPIVRILTSVFKMLLTNVRFIKVIPSDYRLFQLTDLLCTIELTKLKVDNKLMSKSEKLFFGDIKTFEKNYWKPIKQKMMK